MKKCGQGFQDFFGSFLVLFLDKLARFLKRLEMVSQRPFWRKKTFTDHILPSKAKRKIKLYSSGNICHRASVEGQWLLHCEMPGWQGGSQGGLECQVGPACQQKPQSPAAAVVSSKIFHVLPIPHIGAIHPRAWRLGRNDFQKFLKIIKPYSDSFVCYRN